MSDINVNQTPSLLDRIKAEYLQARKDKNEFVTKAFSTFIGEFETKTKGGKVPVKITDEVVIEAIRSTLKRLNDLQGLISDPVKLIEVNLEKNLFQNYLPTQLSDNEVQILIENARFVNMGQIQMFFKTNYPGRYDGKVVAQIGNAYLKANPQQ